MSANRAFPVALVAALAGAPMLADTFSPLTFSNTMRPGDSVTITKTVTISAAPTAIATGVATVFTSPVTGITFTPGRGYFPNTTSPTTCAITGGGGSGATCTAILPQPQDCNIEVGCGLSNVVLVNAGAGYTTVPNCAISLPNFNGGTAGPVPATCAMQISPAAGTVAGINVTNGGIGYPSAPACTITGGGGSGATCTTQINAAGAVTGINVTNPGSGFTSLPTVTIAAPPAPPSYSVGLIFHSPVPAGVQVCGTATTGLCVALPPAATGDRSVERTFSFPVTFRALTAGFYSFSIDAVTIVGSGQTIVGTESDTITVSSPLSLNGTCPTGPLASGTSVSVPLTASGGNGNYRLSLSGPSWLALSALSPPAGFPANPSFTPSSQPFAFTVSGTPPPGVGAGPFVFTVILNDTAESLQQQFQCSISFLGALSLPGTCPAGPLALGAPVSVPLTASGGNGNYRLSLSGPTWLALSALSPPAGFPANPSFAPSSQPFAFTVSGTPPPNAGTGPFVFTVTLNDTAGSPPQTFQCSISFFGALSLPGTCPAGPLALGASVSVPLTASGGNGNYRLSLSGPTWLALSALSPPAGFPANPSFAPSSQPFAFTVSGTPPPGVGAGPFVFTVTLNDTAGSPPQTFQCSISFFGALSLPGTCPAGPLALGASVSVPLTASGGNGNYRLSLSGPTWLALSALSPPAGFPANPSFASSSQPFAFTVSGTPPPNAGTGPFVFTVTLNDTAGSPPQTFQCSISFLGVLSLTGFCPGSVQAGAPVSVLLTASGGNNIYSLSYSGPSWLSLSATSGAGASFSFSLVGTAPGDGSGSGAFTVTLTDTTTLPNRSAPAIFACTITINQPVRISAACPASPMTIGQNYSQTLTANGGIGGFLWSISNGSLPPGLTQSGNIISGSPTTPGNYAFSVQVTSGSQTDQVLCSIRVEPPPVVLTSGCPPGGKLGQPFAPFPLTATGGLGPGSYTFQTAGFLPGGLSIKDSSIVGTPTTAGAFNFRIQVVSGTAAATGGMCSMTIDPPIGQLTITGVCPASSVQPGAPVSVSVSASGGVPPYSFSLSVPPGSGLSLSSNGTGATVAGTPPAAGIYPFSVTVTDANSTPATFSCSVTVAPSPLQISGSCPSSSLNQNALFTSSPLGALGGQGTYTWSLSGPPWLSLSSASGAATSFTGTPPAAGTFALIVTLNDDAGSKAASLNCTLTVNSLPPLTITPGGAGCPTSPLVIPAQFSLPLTAGGGQAPYNWNLSGATWLSLSSSAGTAVTVSGTPPASGDYPFTVTLADSSNSTPATYSCPLTVNGPVIPPITLSLSATLNLLQPATPTLTLTSPVAVPLQGTVQLTFKANGAVDADNPRAGFVDPSTQSVFRIATFTIPAGAQTVPLPGIRQDLVAGTINVELVSVLDGTRDVTPVPHVIAPPLVVPKLPPVITDVSFQNETATGFDIIVSGYSTPRDMLFATVTFAAPEGASLDVSQGFANIDLKSQFDAFYRSAVGIEAGSTFTGLRIPVTIDGDKTAIASVKVVLTNSVNSSEPFTKAR